MDIKKKEKELFKESVLLKETYMELSKTKGTFEKCRELKRKQDKIYHKQQFYKNLIKEMEKMK